MRLFTLPRAVGVFALLASVSAQASIAPTPLPEPGIWSLLAIGAVGLIVGARFWRKK